MPDRSEPWNRWDLAALALGALSRAWDLGRESLWLDELASVTVARLPSAELVRVLGAFDNHPPLYFLGLRAWTLAAGFGDAAVRVPSALAGTALVALCGALAGSLAGPRARTIALWLAASSSFLLFHAREARNYSLLGALVLAAAVAQRRSGPSLQARPALGLALASLAALYTHVFAPFSLAAVALAASVAWSEGDRSLAALRRGLAGALFVGAGFLPWAWVILGQWGRVRRGFWLPRPGLAWLVEWGGRGPSGALVSGALVLGAAVGARRLWARDRSGAVLVAGLSALPVAAPWLWSYAAQPVLQGRYTVAAMASALVGCSVALASLEARRGAALTALLVASGAWTSVRDVHRATRHEQWRELARFGSREALAEGLPVLVPRYGPTLDHYLDPRARRWLFPRATTPQEVLRALGAELDGARGFWLLAVHPETVDPALEGLLRSRFRPVRSRGFLRARATLWLRNP